jgi:hypothetical protein
LNHQIEFVPRMYKLFARSSTWTEPNYERFYWAARPTRKDFISVSYGRTTAAHRLPLRRGNNDRETWRTRLQSF